MNYIYINTLHYINHQISRKFAYNNVHKCWKTFILGAKRQFWPYVMTCVRKCRSSITKLGIRISRERFDLESPWTCIPVGSTTTPDMTSLVPTSCLKLSQQNKRKMPPLLVSGRISWEWFMRGPPKFARLSGTTGLLNRLDMTALAACSRLQNAVKCCTKVRTMVPGSLRVEWFGHCLT